MPFSTYKDFQDCLKKNKGKDDPEAYCAELKRKTEKVVDWNYHLSFVKLAGTEEDVMYIAGEASNPDEDEDGELMDMESLKGAYSSYMANPVIKFMHDKAPQWRGAIGKVIEKYTDSDGTVWKTSFGAKPFLVAKFVKGTMPGWMWKGIQEGNYKGFSIGGKALKKVAGRIYVKSWLETSVVDVPSAHGAFFNVLKMACSGDDCYFLKGGVGSGIKGHRTEREKGIRQDLIVETAKNMYMDNADLDEVDHIKKLLKKEIAFRIKNKEYSKQEINDIGLDMHIMVGEIQNQMRKRKIERKEGRKKMVKNPQINSFIKTINDYVLDSFLR